MGKFVIIGGMPRSGTNLARRIIGSHSRIAVPPAEFQFFRQYARGKSVQSIMENKRLEDWHVDFSDLYPLEHRDAFIKTLERYTENLGKDIPGEKSPLNEFYYEIIEDWLQGYDLKFIHMLRNPFDMLASYKHAPFRREKPRKIDPVLPVNARNWWRSAAFGLARSRFQPERYYLLKYEDLTADPVAVTRDLCQFLGVEFESDRMLNLTDYKQYKDNTSFPTVAALETREVGAVRQAESRKQYLNPAEIQTIGAICGELARGLGYEDEDFKSMPPEDVVNTNLEKRLKRAVRRSVWPVLALKHRFTPG